MPREEVDQELSNFCSCGTDRIKAHKDWITSMSRNFSGTSGRNTFLEKRLKGLFFESINCFQIHSVSEPWKMLGILTKATSSRIIGFSTKTQISQNLRSIILCGKFSSRISREDTLILKKKNRWKGTRLAKLLSVYWPRVNKLITEVFAQLVPVGRTEIQRSKFVSAVK